MLTATFTSTVGMKIPQASQAPMSSRIISNMPRPPDSTPTREAESRAITTIGTTYSAHHSRSNPNHAPASRRVATAPAPIIPAAVSAAGPTRRARAPKTGARSKALQNEGRAATVAVLIVSSSTRHPPAVDHQDVAVDVVGSAGRQKDHCAGQIPGVSPTPGRDPLQNLAAPLGVRPQGGGVVGGHVAWRDRVDVDPEGGPLVRERLGELRDA